MQAQNPEVGQSKLPNLTASHEDGWERWWVIGFLWLMCSHKNGLLPCSLQATNEYMVEHIALQKLDLSTDKPWYLRWWVLLDIATPILNVAPHVVPVVPMSSRASAQAHPVKRARRAPLHPVDQAPLEMEVPLAGDMVEPDTMARAEALQFLAEHGERSKRQRRAAPSQEEQQLVALPLGHAIAEPDDVDVDVDQGANSIPVGLAIAEAHPAEPVQNLEHAEPHEPLAHRAFHGRAARQASVSFEADGHISFHESKQAFEARCSRHPPALCQEPAMADSTGTLE